MCHLFLKLPMSGVHMTRGEGPAGPTSGEGSGQGNQLMVISTGTQQVDRLGWGLPGGTRIAGMCAVTGGH